MSTEAEDLVAVEPREKVTVAVPESGASVKPVPSSSALVTEHLQKSYGRRRVVDNVSLFVEPGEVVGLLGANGAGKTTPFYMIKGLERQDQGRIRLGKQDLTNLPMYLRARLGLGSLPQEPS